MARWFEPDPLQVAVYAGWVASRPPDVRAVASRFEPWSLYRLGAGGPRVVVVGFSEGGAGPVTVIVNVSSDWNGTVNDRDIAGVDPDDLWPCELPEQVEASCG